MKKLIIILSLFLLSGCYNYKELNDLAITTALGIDKTEKGYKITAQVVNTNKTTETTSDDPQISVYSFEDTTIQEAIRQITMESPNRLYIHQLQIMLISEEVAKDGIENIIDIFFRGVEARKQFDVLIAADTTAEDILKTLTPIDTLVSSNIKKSLITNSKYLGTSYEITFEQMLSNYLDKNKEIFLPSVTLVGNPEIGENTENIKSSDVNAKIILSTLGIFKDDKLLGYIDKEESIGLNIITNNINSSIVSYECETDKYIVARIIHSKTNINIEKNKLKIGIDIEGNGNIGEINCYLDLEKNSSIKEIEKNVNKEIERIVNKTLTTIINSYNSDVFGFLDLYYKNNYKYYLEIEKNWYNSNLKKLEFDVKSKIKLIEKGNIIKVSENNEQQN